MVFYLMSQNIVLVLQAVYLPAYMNMSQPIPIIFFTEGNICIYKMYVYNLMDNYLSII